MDNALLLKAVGANGYVLTFPVGDGIPLSGNFCRPRPLLSYQFACAYRISPFGAHSHLDSLISIPKLLLLQGPPLQ